MAYIIGIDGGGTKTTALFSCCESDLGYHSLDQRVVGEAINPQLIGFEEMKGRLKRLIQKGMETFSISPEQITGMSVGLAGVRHEEDHQKVQEKLRDIVLELEFSENIVLSSFSDVYIALRGSLKPNDEAGILVISGTGSNAIGLTNKGEIYRSGGWGHILGDEGSGYQIGLRALNKICRAYDLRDQPTLLSAMIINQLDLKSEEDLISFIYGSTHEKKVIAGFAEHVIEASEQDDETAIAILEASGRELALHVESLFRQSGDFHEATPVATTGSIFEHSRILKDCFVNNLKAKKLGRYQQAYSDPASGAVLTAHDLITKPTKKAGWSY